MAKTNDRQQETDRRESLVKVAESQGVPRPLAEEIVNEAISEGVAPKKLKEVVEETAKVEREDQKLATDRED